MDENDEWGVICTNCLSQYRHNEYNANENQLFICPNCGETEHFREWILPKKKRFNFQMNWLIPGMLIENCFHRYRQLVADNPDKLW